jgi:hypothetical protein
MTAVFARVMLVALVAAGSASPLRAQTAASTAARAEPELRVDVITGRRRAVQAGVGILIPMGYYVRLGADGTLGLRTGDVAGSRVDGRVDVVGRFLLDPFLQSPIGVSGGAGLSARFDAGERVVPLLLVVVDIEGRHAVSGWAPALQLGLGGGTRIGMVLRRAAAGAR